MKYGRLLFALLKTVITAKMVIHVMIIVLWAFVTNWARVRMSFILPMYQSNLFFYTNGKWNKSLFEGSVKVIVKRGMSTAGTIKPHMKTAWVLKKGKEKSHPLREWLLNG